MKTFDYENFDFDQLYEEVKESIRKPNIMICGGTGVGKSSLINDIFQVTIAAVGNSGRPETMGVSKLLTQENALVNFYDSEGYEIGKVDLDQQDRYYSAVISFIDKRIKEHPSEMESHVHEVWYCVSAGNKRFYDVDCKIISEIKNRKIPVMIVITKVDSVDEEELGQLTSEIRKRVNGVSIYTYSLEIEKSDEETYKQYVQREEIIKWAIEHLDLSLQAGLLSAVKGSLKEKKELALRECVPNHVKLAVACVAGTSFVPVPFSDSVPLMGIQVKMAMSILNIFGINANVKNIVSDLIGTSVVSYLGKTFASQILSWIPFVGPAAKAVVNVSVAASITGILGVGITLIAEQYCSACVDHNGVANLTFSEFLTMDRFRETMEYVKNHKEEFGIDKMVKEILNKTKKK